MQVKVALAAGFVLASPVWLYEIWAFVTPGLQRNERRWTIAFLATGVPLFIAGGAFCYLILPRTTSVLLGFTPDQVGSIVDFNEFLSIVIRLMLVFGLGFEVPVFVVLLNLLGFLPARKLAGLVAADHLGIFLFAAVATPTGDPLTMTVLALPLCVLVLASYLVARIHDARRGQRDIDYAASMIRGLTAGRSPRAARRWPPAPQRGRHHLSRAGCGRPVRFARDPRDRAARQPDLGQGQGRATAAARHRTAPVPRLHRRRGHRP